MSEQRPGPSVDRGASHLNGAALSSAYRYSLVGELAINSAITCDGGATGIKPAQKTPVHETQMWLPVAGQAAAPQPELSTDPAITHS